MSTLLLDLTPCAWAKASGIARRPPAHPSPCALALAGTLEGEVEVAVGARLDLTDHAEARRRATRVIIVADKSQHASLEAEGAELLDPWDIEGALDAVPAYALAPTPTTCHAEVDVRPAFDPVHPFCQPAASTLAPDRWLERCEAAVTALAPAPEVDLVLNDDRVPFTMDRLRGAGAIIRRNLRERQSLVRLHLRAHLDDLAGHPMLIEHIPLMPVESLEIMVGSLHPPSRAQIGLSDSTDAIGETLARIKRCGLGHKSSLTLVMGVPGETADDCVEMMQAAFALAVEAHIARVRVSLWFGESASAERPSDPEAQHALFAATHPDWHAIEYRGVFDYAALLDQALPQVSVSGLGLFPGWEPPMADMEQDP